MRNMRRKGSAAPHSSWSPTVKALKYSGPMASLRRRPMGMLVVPLTCAGESAAMEASRVLGTTLTQRLARAKVCSISSSGKSLRSLM